jgi:hypothetical protein
MRVRLSPKETYLELHKGFSIYQGMLKYSSSVITFLMKLVYHRRQVGQILLVSEDTRCP